jgi:hypothetical protein
MISWIGTSLIPSLTGIGGSALSLLGSILLLAAGPAILYLAFKNNFMGITDTFNQLVFIIKYYSGKIMDAFKNINWGALGKSMMWALANGMLMGIPSLIMVATKAATAALNAIKAKLGIHSPSLEFTKLGKFSGQGFQIGLAGAMDPNMIARTMAKPVQNMSSSQNQNITMQFANGLTTRQAESMIAQNNELLLKRLNRALGGV